MARTKEFEPEKALEAAVNVFCRLGYEHTSLDTLMREMGVARQSLYDTFGDKRALYLKALRHYRDGNHATLRDLFVAKKSVREGFSKLLFDLSRETREERERGCFLLSANLELGSRDQEIATLLRRNQRTIEGIFVDALKRGQAHGEISPRQDPTALARLFIAAIQGMRALARLNHDRKALENIATAALASLE
ncbi:MAG: Transcriptional regulator, TetR family protein [Bryobacterales bacterium]|nr:Transcriptional regulator, TetR family protein [Bryobacterales bacterium]